MKSAPAQLLPGESIEIAVRRISDALVNEAIRRVEAPDGTSEEIVHLLRTTTKRLRALLQLIRFAIGQSAFERENSRLKSFASRLSVSRDRAVAAKTMKECERRRKGNTQAEMREGDGTDEDPALVMAEAAAERMAILRTVRDLEATREEFRGLRIDLDGWHAVGPGLVKVYGDARRRMLVARSRRSGRAYHQWRIRTKQLLYQLEWLEPIWPERFAQMRKSLRELEEELGTEHDLLVLREMLAKGAIRPSSEEAGRRLRKVAKKRSRKLKRSCATYGNRIFREKPEKFGAECERHWETWQAKSVF